MSERTIKLTVYLVHPHAGTFRVLDVTNTTEYLPGDEVQKDALDALIRDGVVVKIVFPSSQGDDQ